MTEEESTKPVVFYFFFFQGPFSMHKNSVAQWIFTEESNYKTGLERKTAGYIISFEIK